MPRKKDTDRDRAEAREDAAFDRDYLMARVAAALVSADAAKMTCTEILATFVNPDDDKKGKTRKQLIDDALEAAGAAQRALEDAEAAFDEADSEAFALGEPWEDADDGDEDEEDEDEDD